MLDRNDSQWWILEAQKHPEQAADLIRLLAERLAFLDKQNEALRGELIGLRRKQRGASDYGNTQALQQRIADLEAALREGGTLRKLLVYAPGVLIGNLPLDSGEPALGASIPAGARFVIASANARLLVISAESRAFIISLADLPVPNQTPLPLDSPAGIVAFIDLAAFEQYRYLTLVSQNGYAYSLLAGTLARTAAKQDRLIRNLIPDDPIAWAVPTNNADLFAVSRKSRWLRFPERALSGTGSQLMELARGDSLVGLLSLGTEATLALITQSGRLFARPSADLPRRAVPGKSAGMLIKDHAIVGLTVSNRAVMLTAQGHLLNVSLTDLPARAFGETGMAIPGFTAGDSIVSVS